MTGVDRAVVIVLAFAGCAGPRGNVGPVGGIDTTHVEWGDEHPGLTSDPEEGDHGPARIRLEGTMAETWSTAASAARAGATVRARVAENDASGALEWTGSGPLRRVVAGVVRPSVGEGAVLADRRSDAQLTARRPARVGGLDLAPSTLRWGTALGAGATVAVGATAASFGGWTERDEPSVSSAWGSLAWSERHVTFGASAGVRRSGRDGPDDTPFSVFAGRRDGDTWLSSEVGVTRRGVRTLARALVGDRHQWRATLAAGPAPAAGDRSWGARVERQDAWGAVSQRASLLVSTRRRADSNVRRRRTEWAAGWRVNHRVSLEAAARLTHDEETRTLSSPLVAPIPVERADELRARVSVRTRDAVEGAIVVENQYRLEVVDAPGASAGWVVTWAGRAQHGPIDARVRASAHSLHRDQVAYVSNAGVAGASAYSVASGSRVNVLVSLGIALGRHASLGAQAARSGSDPARVRLVATTVW